MVATMLLFQLLLASLISGTVFDSMSGLAISRMSPRMDLAQDWGPEWKTQSSGTGTFQQLIDHTNPSVGTFSQFYLYNATFWKPGNPILLVAPGEQEVMEIAGIMGSKVTVVSKIAEAIHGAIVVLEHRYWGRSSPYPNLSTKNLRYLTLNQSIEDMNQFALNVRLPFDQNNSSNAVEVPWVVYGGSYPGALAAWVRLFRPETFWASVSSSGVVQADSDFWEYYDQIADHMPENCRNDLAAAIDKIDNILTSGTDSERNNLKEKFGLQTIEHSADFALLIGKPLRKWQDTHFSHDDGFYAFCNQIETSSDSTSAATSLRSDRVENTLAGYAHYIRVYFGGISLHFNSHDSSEPQYSDTSVANQAQRQWLWLKCNEPFGWGAPKTDWSIVSRLLNVEYFTRMCSLYFPPEDGVEVGIAEGATEEEVNALTKGWNFADSTRLLWVVGEWDPWLDATVGSTTRPGGPLPSTEAAPVLTIRGGRHCEDILWKNGDVNPGTREVQNEEVRLVNKWVCEWPGYLNDTTRCP